MNSNSYWKQIDKGKALRKEEKKEKGGEGGGGVGRDEGKERKRKQKVTSELKLIRRKV